jgi:uncharacterized membrane protein YccF (DUF307 family)
MPQKDLNIIIRVIWFYFIGLPVGIIWLHIAWFFGITLIGLPICLWMINLAPAIMTLKQEHNFKEFKIDGKTAFFIDETSKNTSFLMRAIYFLLVGWWLSLLWTEFALLASATFFFIPVGFWMINRLPFIMTLKQN